MKRSLRNKVVYLVIMALLLIPLSWLGQPATAGIEGGRGSSGGTLAQMREANDLSHGDLGEIDPTSEALKLALFGMRGLAATVTWEQAREYQMKEDWTNLDLKLEQISRLQPHFVMVWRHQAWNLSYNVSAEWDDYRDRYYWVIRGLKYLMRGQPYNNRDTRLVWDEGWFIGQKIGKSDEHRQFRPLFRANAINPIHPEGRPEGDPRDNWQVAHGVFTRGLEMYNQGIELRGANPLIFFSEPSRCTIRFVAAREEEGQVRGDYPHQYWRRARDEWKEFTSMAIPAATLPGVYINLDALPFYNQEANRAEDELNTLAAGIRERLEAERRSQLTEEELKLVDLPEDAVKEEDVERRGTLMARVLVTPMDVAQQVPEDKRPEAMHLALQLQQLRGLAQITASSRHTVNYDYWEKRCEAEQSMLVKTRDGRQVVGVEQTQVGRPVGEVRLLTPNGEIETIAADNVAEVIDLGVGARRDLFEAYHAYRTDPLTAKPHYERSFEKWRVLLDAYPILVGDGDINDDLTMASRRYDVSLQRRNLPFPKENYILNDVLEARPPDPPIGD